MISSKTAFGIALLAAASASHALSLGSPRGAAVIGQPLQLAFDLTLDSPSDGGSACVQVELFYGETRVDPSRVQVATLPGAQPTMTRIQLASAIAVNEPVVSIVMRAGCGQGLSRRYVLLASSPTAQPEPLPGAVLPERLAEPARRGGAPSSARVSGRGSDLPTAADAAVSPGASARVAPPTRAARPATPLASSPEPSTRRSDAAAAEKQAARGVPRLELQSPTDWLDEHNLPLRPSLEMSAPAAAVTPEQRAAATAAWRRLFAEASPEIAAAADVDQTRNLRTLEEQVKNLQTGIDRNRSREAELQARLEEAESERSLYLWGAVVAAALLLAAVLFFLLGRGRAGGQDRSGSGAVWWRPRAPAGGTPIAPSFQDPVAGGPDTGAHGALPVAAAPLPPLVIPPKPKSRTQVADAAPVRPPVAVPVHADPAVPEPAMQPPPVLPAVALSSSAAAATAAAHELRALDNDALLDVQQNAEFYVSLGQYEQAIELLQGYIAAHPGVNPAVYLDLLKILHTLSLTDAYRKLREEFNASFNADVPVFAGFLKSLRRLEDYPEALGRIEAHWERDDVLDVVEDYLFKKTGARNGTPFELEAYRELLLLHAVARIAIQQDARSRQGTTAALRGAAAGSGADAAAARGTVASASVPLFEASAQPLAQSAATAASTAVPPDLADGYQPSFPLQALNPSPVMEDIGLEPLTFELPPAHPQEGRSRAAAPGFGPAPPIDDNLIDFDLLDMEILNKGKAPNPDR